MDDILKQLERIRVDQRVLLLPHCLRQSSTCKAKYDKQGLKCIHCNPVCAVNLLTDKAARSGYRWICVAPGGRLAVKFVKEKHPRAVVAVACAKELDEGIQGVQGQSDGEATPLIVVIPLSKDGCIDTEVDIEKALEIINLGALETLEYSLTGT
jgi:hypothetical protein